MTTNEVMQTLQDWHDLSEQYPDISEAAVVGGAVAAWYAMPDFVESSAVRFVGKTSILAGVAAYYYHLPGVPDAVGETGKQLSKQWEKSYFGQQSNGVQIAVLGGAVVAGLMLNSAIERYLLHRGERRRAKGKTLPHLRQGLFLGTLAGGVTYLSARNK
ncbi:MAG: hypothetical protein Q4P06_09410 [Actinomycetaceae bacterium]|nr:hypothetical protein [Actinomycetaceae bacterium]